MARRQAMPIGMSHEDTLNFFLSSPRLLPEGSTRPLETAMSSPTSSQPSPQPFQAPTASGLSEAQSNTSTLAGSYGASPGPHPSKAAMTSYMNGVYDRPPSRVGGDDNIELAEAATSSSCPGQPHRMQLRPLADTQGRRVDGCGDAKFCHHCGAAGVAAAAAAADGIDSSTGQSQERADDQNLTAAAARVTELERQNWELKQKLACFCGTARDVLCQAWASTPHSSIRTPAFQYPASCYSPRLTPQVRRSQHGCSHILC